MGLKSTTSLFFLMFLFSVAVLGQEFGLGFAGQEVVQDQRTGLNLTPKDPLRFDKSFELSFDLSFIPGYTDYYGYIFRIVDKERRNIDFVYDRRYAVGKHFKLIIGEKFSNISFDLDKNQLFKKWHRIVLKFDLERQQLILNVDGKSFEQSLAIKPNAYRIFFGLSNDSNVRSTDVTPMKIRHLAIADQEKERYRWPLDEHEGNIAHEIIKGADAYSTNPIWLRQQHYRWQDIGLIKSAGYVSVAFDSHEEKLLIVSQDSLVTYAIAERKIKSYPNQRTLGTLKRGNQSVYDTTHHKLYNFYVDEKLVSAYDTTTHAWDVRSSGPDSLTNYWHVNKFYSSTDSSLYIIGGYGQFSYKRKFYRYHIPSKQWSEQTITGDYVPRYLAALGNGLHGAYILGGFGSMTGQQMLNAKNIYDMNFFDFKTKKFKKLFAIDPRGDDFTFANSMIIDEPNNTYYALSYANHSYNTSLKLIKGSLSTPDYEIFANDIPYNFHDVQSFADLFYCPESNLFVAVTIFYDLKLKQSIIKVFTLDSPPENLSEIKVVSSCTLGGVYLWSVLVVGVLLIIFLFVSRQRKTYREKVKMEQNAFYIKETPHAPKDTERKETPPTDAVYKNTVFLFGDIQFFDREGEDSTKYFTPLIRELFLLVLLHSIRLRRGIHNDKLLELLWFDKSIDSARNNRSVNIAKLKSILENFDGCKLSKEANYLKIEIDSDKYVLDLFAYQEIVKHRKTLDLRDLYALEKITQRGAFLANVDYNWLDNFKSEISNEIIDTYLHFTNSIAIKHDYEALIRIANNIFYFDHVSEEAMTLKCRSLMLLGKHSLAKQTYESFSKEYAAIYDTEFNRSFQEIIG